MTDGPIFIVGLIVLAAAGVFVAIAYLNRN